MDRLLDSCTVNRYRSFPISPRRDQRQRRYHRKEQSTKHHLHRVDCSVETIQVEAITDPTYLTSSPTSLSRRNDEQSSPKRRGGSSPPSRFEKHDLPGSVPPLALALCAGESVTGIAYAREIETKGFDGSAILDAFLHGKVFFADNDLCME